MASDRFSDALTWIERNHPDGIALVARALERDEAMAAFWAPATTDDEQLLRDGSARAFNAGQDALGHAALEGVRAMQIVARVTRERDAAIQRSKDAHQALHDAERERDEAVAREAALREALAEIAGSPVVMDRIRRECGAAAVERIRALLAKEST